MPTYEVVVERKTLERQTFRVDAANEHEAEENYGLGEAGEIEFMDALEDEVVSITEAGE